MTSTRDILNRLVEELSFDQLFSLSEPRRVLRSKTVRVPALNIEAYHDSQYFYFNAKSFPSSTGQRWKGYIKFKAPDDPNTPLEQLPCTVDCGCPDYKYRFAWANHDRDASEIGSNSVNQCIDRAPRTTNPSNRPGLCKHLLALRNFLYGQDSHFLPADDAEDENSRRSKLVAKANEESRLAQLASRANGAVIDDTGAPVTQEPGDTSGTVPAAPADAALGTPGPAVAPVPQPPSAAQRELELRRRQQIRTQGGDPDAVKTQGEVPAAPEEPTPVSAPEPNRNPTNPRNQRNATNPRNKSGKPPRRESLVAQPHIVNRMVFDTKVVQEMADAAQADVTAQTAASPAKTPSEQALDALQGIQKLLGELVQLNKTAEPEAEAPVDPEAGPDEAPTGEVQPPPQPARQATPRRVTPVA